MSRCNNKAPKSNIAIELQNKIISQSKISSDIPNTNIYINIQYHVIYKNENENISLEKIRAQHDVINNDFNNKNYDLSKVPKLGNYNFSGSIGNPSINFLPLNSSQISEENISRIPTDKNYFTGINDVVLNGNSSPVANVLNVYICNLNNLLGEAYIQNNKCVVLYSSVGGGGNTENINSDTLGTIQYYNFGRTLTHEIGHNFGLYHIFMDIYSGDVCSHNQLHPDIPKQSRSNGFNAILFKNSDNQWEGQGAYNTCSEYDQFMNFMDYVIDQNMVMFSKDQSRIMNLFVSTSGLFKLEQNPTINDLSKPYNLYINNDNITHNSLSLSWEYDIIDSIIFIVEIQKENNNFIIYNKTSNTSIIIDQLLPGTNYTFRVSAELDNIVSEPSINSNTITTKIINPERVNKPLFYNLNDSFISLYWHTPNLNGGTINKYLIKIIENNNENNIETIVETIDTYIHHNINKSYKYNFYIKAITKNDNTEYQSLEWSLSSDTVNLKDNFYKIYSNGIINKPIPENNNLTLNTLLINDLLTIDKLELIIHDISHSWVGDIKLDIEFNDIKINLINSPGEGIWGSENDNFKDTILSSDGIKSIEDLDNELPPHTGIYKPMESLDIYKDKECNGDWNITIEDLYPIEDNGTLKLWSLKIYYKERLFIWEEINLTVNVSHNHIELIDISKPNVNYNSFDLRYKSNNIEYINLDNTQINGEIIENLIPNTTYIIDVRYKNNLGYSEWYQVNKFNYNNETLNFLKTNAYIPEWYDSLLLNINKNIITINWKKPNNNGSEILNYKLILLNNDDILFEKEISNLILQEMLTLFFFNLELKIQIFAINSIGESLIESNLFYIENIVPFWENNNLHITNDIGTSFIINWDIPKNGGSEIIKYLVEVNHSNITQNFDTNTNLMIFNSEPNINYTIKIIAINEVGTSENLIIEYTSIKILPYWSNLYLNCNLIDHNNLEITWNYPNSGGRKLTHFKLILDNKNKIEIIETWKTKYIFKNLLLDINYPCQIVLYAGCFDKKMHWSLSNIKDINLDTLMPYWLENNIININSNYNDKLSVSFKPCLSLSDVIYDIKLVKYDTEGYILVNQHKINNTSIIFIAETNQKYIITLQAENKNGLSSSINIDNIYILYNSPKWKTIKYKYENNILSWEVPKIDYIQNLEYIINMNEYKIITTENSINLTELNNNKKLIPEIIYSLFIKCKNNAGVSNQHYIGLLPNKDKLIEENNKIILDIDDNYLIINCPNLIYDICDTHEINIYVNNQFKFNYIMDKSKFLVNINSLKTYINNVNDYLEVYIKTTNDSGVNTLISDKLYLLKKIPFWDNLQLINNNYQIEWSLPSSNEIIEYYLINIDNKEYKTNVNYIKENIFNYHKLYSIDIKCYNKNSSSYNYNLLTLPNKILPYLINTDIDYYFIDSTSLRLSWNFESGGNNYSAKLLIRENINSIRTINLYNTTSYLLKNIINDRLYSISVQILCSNFSGKLNKSIYFNYIYPEIKIEPKLIDANSVLLEIDSNININNILINSEVIKEYKILNLLPDKNYDLDLLIKSYYKDIVKKIKFKTLSGSPMWTKNYPKITNIDNTLEIDCLGMHPLNTEITIKIDDKSYIITDSKIINIKLDKYNKEYKINIISKNDFGKMNNSYTIKSIGYKPIFISDNIKIITQTSAFFEITYPNFNSGFLDVNTELYIRSVDNLTYTKIDNFVILNDKIKIFQNLPNDSYNIKIIIYNNYGSDFIIKEIILNNNYLYWDEDCLNYSIKNDKLFLNWNKPYDTIINFKLIINNKTIYVNTLNYIEELNLTNKFINIEIISLNKYETKICFIKKNIPIIKSNYSKILFNGNIEINNLSL